MTDVTDHSTSIKPRKPGASTARANGARRGKSRGVVFVADEELFMMVKRFAMRTNKTISQSIRQILRARLSR